MFLPCCRCKSFITIAAIVTLSGQLVFVFNLFWSMFKGEVAVGNPWDSTTLEWTLPSPAPAEGFGSKPQFITNGPYEYSVPGMEKDFVMQNALIGQNPASRES